MAEKRTIDKYAPWLLPEWSDKNAELTPADVTIGSHKKVWWKGTCGHEWQAIVKNRVSGSGCPFCSGNAVLPGFNDVSSIAPWLVREWSDRNGELKPSDLTSQANRKVWWKGRCGHSWQARVADRVKKHTKCPYCTNERIERGVNDLTALMPKLAEELAGGDTDDEEDLWTIGPQVHTVNSHRMMRWKCSICGCEWNAQIYTRVRGGAGCPECRKKRQEERLQKRFRIDQERVSFIKNMPWIAVRFYLKRAEESFCFRDESMIGIPIDFYIPKRNGAIIIADPIPSKIRQKATAAACSKAGIRLVYIVPGGGRIYRNCHCITMTEDSPEVWSEAIRAAMELLGIDVEVNIRKDRELIFNEFQKGLCYGREEGRTGEI